MRIRHQNIEKITKSIESIPIHPWLLDLDAAFVFNRKRLNKVLLIILLKNSDFLKLQGQQPDIKPQEVRQTSWRLLIQALQEGRGIWKQVIFFRYKSPIMLNYSYNINLLLSIMESRKNFPARPRKYSEVISEKVPTFLYSYKSQASLSKVERNYGKLIMEQFKAVPSKNPEEMQEEAKGSFSEEFNSFYSFETELSECCEEIWAQIQMEQSFINSGITDDSSDFSQ